MMRNPEAKHLDFSELKGLIQDNDKWLPSNIDMMAERKGKFLVCEWKRPMENFGGGQKILLKQLAKQSNFTVVIVVGNTDNGMAVDKFWRLTDKEQFEVLGTSIDEYKRYVKNWYINAEN